MALFDYVGELYESREISIREAAEILQLNFRQTMDILEKKVGGNVEPEQETREYEASIYTWEDWKAHEVANAEVGTAPTGGDAVGSKYTKLGTT